MENKVTDAIQIRSIKPEDHNFILLTWSKGVFYGSRLEESPRTWSEDVPYDTFRNILRRKTCNWWQEVDSDTFNESYLNFIAQVLKRPETEVRVACLKEDEDEIKGYTVLDSSRKALHFVYVKEAWRKQGIAKKLLPDLHELKITTQLTTLGKRLKPSFMKFNPFLI